MTLGFSRQGLSFARSAVANKLGTAAFAAVVLATALLLLTWWALGNSLSAETLRGCPVAGANVNSLFAALPSTARSMKLASTTISQDGLVFPFHSFVAPQELISSHVQNTKTVYCPTEVVAMVKHCVKRHGSRCTFADVGANIGSCSTLAGLLGARVFAFEAVRENAFVVYQNVVANGLRDRVDVFPFGVSDRADQLNVYRLADNSGHNMVGKLQERLKSQYTADVTTVCRLDALLEQHVHVMKLDVEGHEFEALRGASALVKDFGVDELYFEFSQTLLTSDNAHPDRAAELLDYLRDVLKMTIYSRYNEESGEMLDAVSPSSFRELGKATKGSYSATDLFAKASS